MFRSQQHLENVSYTQFDLDTPITIPGNNQIQKKTNYKFFQETGTFFMTGTTLISASITSLKLKQTEPTLALTLNQLQSMVLSH